MATEPWDDTLTQALKSEFGEDIRQFATYRSQQFIAVKAEAVERVLRSLRQRGFEYLVDVTAVHWPKREKQFDVLWILYSFAENRRVRVKAELADGAVLPSATPIWQGADWLEREVFDMFGIRFSGHPDLRRILLPEDWTGHPLRKEYPITLQDQNWVKLNLGIESGQ